MVELDGYAPSPPRCGRGVLLLAPQPQSLDATAGLAPAWFRFCRPVPSLLARARRARPWGLRLRRPGRPAGLPGTSRQPPAQFQVARQRKTSPRVRPRWL